MIPTRPLGRTGLQLSVIGFGAFKIGRNQGIKYPRGYELPDESSVERLLNALLDAGITYIDTAPAYGLSEERIGRAIGRRRREFVLSTKVGETFLDGRSIYDFSRQAVQASVHRSLKRLKTDILDIVFIHSNGDDLAILRQTDVVPTLLGLRDRGDVRAVGLSGKTVEGARDALQWADALMVEYHLNDRSHEEVIEEAARQGVGVVVKKGLASGHLSPDAAIPFVLGNPFVSSLVIGGLNIQHMRANLQLASCANRLAG
ncbi:MAG: aldo/keto reductase [Planctomycetes bacterium]|nr:aldo/keto reductase [Planctomycetota bacterium]